MAEGYVSDIDGDDAVMDSPEVTVSIDLSQLPPEQAATLAQTGDLSQQEPYEMGLAMQGNEDAIMEDIEFHLPLGPALTMLSQFDVIDVPSEPPEEPEVDIDE